jgi:hypothetical protein
MTANNKYQVFSAASVRKWPKFGLAGKIQGFPELCSRRTYHSELVRWFTLAQLFSLSSVGEAEAFCHSLRMALM